MAKNLVIVESPAKAKTISKLLGSDYLVKPSFGHIRDLSKKKYGVDLDNNYEPVYEIDPEKKHVVAELRKDVKAAETVWLASDEDREGEAIAWHLAVVLKLPIDSTKRIVFHEITKNAIQDAVKSPRTIDINLVNAQQARRVLDRLVGFELSEVLWKKVKSGLSAGRVQSVAVRLIVEREREILAFKVTDFFKATAQFATPDGNFKAEYNGKLETQKDAEEFLNSCNGSGFAVKSVDVKPGKKSPAPPFTTSTLQQEASRKLGFSVSQTMALAQTLYEEGYITYMRTDSVNLSQLAVNAAKEFITKEYGDKYSHPRTFKTKTKGAQEAHEAIRPTTMRTVVSQKYDEQRLYDIIFKRTIASQMSDAVIEKTTAVITADKNKAEFTATGEVVKFDGFLKVYHEGTDDETTADNQLLPPLKAAQNLDLDHIEINQRFTRPPARYTEASLVKRLEELGIGRPSTYAPIITTIIKRGYVLKEDRQGTERNYVCLTLKNGKVTTKTKKENTGYEKNKLFSSDIAMVVTDFLSDHFKNVMDYNFTASVEKEFDEIAEGNLEWAKMIDSFYSPFHVTTQKSVEDGERTTGERVLGVDPKSGKTVSARIGRFGPIIQLGEKDDSPVYASLPKDQHIENLTLEDALALLNNEQGGRLLGTDPQTGKNIYARVGRFGPMVQLGETNDTPKPKYAALLKGQTVETITLAQALKLFELPRDLGEYEGKKVTVAVGRFGPFISHNSKFISLKKTDNPVTITMERAIELILEKAETDKKKLIKEFSADFKIVRDRWNHPVIYYKKKYYKLATTVDAEKLTEEDCMKVIGEGADDKSAAKKTVKKTTAKKSASSKK
ncbi:MAG: type I DNA topoisomerase [Bacteroidales bacterium]|nr:type I DNA topoisomerase [Bacteroidales bacterium]MBO7142139.1 type I DNA topoisomerase [Bacteroidales bacterium]